MKQRITTLTFFLIKNFFRSLVGTVPLGLTLAAYAITFRYPGDVYYFAGVGGASIAVICLITTSLFAHHINRAYTYPLVARLPNRTELLITLFFCAYLVTLVMALLFTILVIGTGRLSPTLSELLLIAPRWLILFVFVTNLGLHMTKLVSRNGSYLVAYSVIIVLLTIPQERFRLSSGTIGILIDGMSLLVKPLTDALLAQVSFAELQGYFVSLLFTLLYAGLLFLLAVRLFRDKDLLWSE